jgi:glycosyltransferase involved in cell wall biosynthesis
MIEFELVIPAYNESASLKKLIERVKEAALKHGFDTTNFRLLLVQNGSTDDSASVLSTLAQSELGPWFRVLHIPLNRGYGYGLYSGLKASIAPYLAYTHADLQCDPNDSFRGLKILRESNDPKLLVKGSRIGRSRAERFVSRVFELFAKLILDLNVYELNAQPKIFSRCLLEKLSSPPDSFAFDLYLLYQAKKAGYKFETIEVLFPAREHGVSKWAATTLSRYKTILGMIRYMFRLRIREGKA